MKIKDLCFLFLLLNIMYCAYAAPDGEDGDDKGDEGGGGDGGDEGGDGDADDGGGESDGGDEGDAGGGGDGGDGADDTSSVYDELVTVATLKGFTNSLVKVEDIRTFSNGYVNTYYHKGLTNESGLQASDITIMIDGKPLEGYTTEIKNLCDSYPEGTMDGHIQKIINLFFMDNQECEIKADTQVSPPVETRFNFIFPEIQKCGNYVLSIKVVTTDGEKAFNTKIGWGFYVNCEHTATSNSIDMDESSESE